MNAKNNLTPDLKKLPEYKNPTNGADTLISQITDQAMEVINLTERINKLSDEARTTYNLAVNMFRKNPSDVLNMLEQDSYGMAA